MRPGPGGLFLFHGTGRAIFFLAWLVSAAYVFAYRNRGWIPHDEGILGQAAESVLNGALPHRDFPEIYTGGLSYWNALAFRLFGVRLTSIRLMLFLSFLSFVPPVFAIAARFGPPLAAGAVTLLAVAWSLPNYFASIPSWYNLFLAAWAVLALLRHIETGRERWLFAAGLFIGVSCLFKVIGAHLLAAALLLLLYRERDRTSNLRAGQSGTRITAYLVFLAAGLALFLALLYRVLQSHLRETEFVYYFLPAAAICGFLLWRESREGGGRFATRLLVLARLAFPLVAGTALPIALFVAWFAVQGAVASLWTGVLAGTGAHVQMVRMWMPALKEFLPACPYAIVLGLGSTRRIPFAPFLLLLLAAAALSAFLFSASSPEAYVALWHSARFLAPLAVFVGCSRLADWHRSAGETSETREKVFLLTSVVAMTGLVQFPFAAPIYFFYFAPLLVLLVHALVGAQPRPPFFVHATALALYLAFALFRTNPGYVYGLGHHFESYDPKGSLDLPRAGGLRVESDDALLYRALIPLVVRQSGGRPIYAGPDSPQVHFLSGLPEAVSYREGSPRSPLEDPESLFRSLRERGSAVVLNFAPLFEPQLDAEVLARFETLFPRSRRFGAFVARWRE